MTRRDKRGEDIKDSDPSNLPPALSWRSPCCGFTYLAVPGRETINALSRLQKKIASVEPTLLSTPRHSLHITILPLLKVRQNYGEDKHLIWRRHGAGWTRTISRPSRRSRLTATRYTSLRVTESAIIALLQPSDEVNEYRQDLLASLNIADAQPPSQLLHTTLFRFGRPLRHSGRLLELLADEVVEIPLTSADAMISHEITYPHLEFQVLLRWPIDSPGRHYLRRDLPSLNDHPNPGG